MKQTKLTEKDLVNLQDEDKTANCYREWCESRSDIISVIKKLTITGIAKYSLQLVVVEISMIISIYLIRVILDYIQTRGETSFPGWYPYALFVAFCIFRMIAICMRNYYDLHVYNYFKYVENTIKAYLFRDVERVKQWQMRENKRSAVLNILTKDIEAFVNGSWQFPYMVVVPINTVISMFILYSMVRIVSH